MPIVRVEMFRGRTTVMKEFLGRAIVDAVSEIAGPPRENVQVVFSDVGTDEWAIGPTLVSSRPPAPAPAYVPAVVVVESVALKAGKSDGVPGLAARRRAPLPVRPARFPVFDAVERRGGRLRDRREVDDPRGPGKEPGR